MEIKFNGIGWRSRIIQKRATFYMSINKLVAEGCGLEKSQEIYSYLADDENERKVIITYLDGGKQTKIIKKYLSKIQINKFKP